MKPKVSVIVPVYNVEKYLRQCLDSILAQTLKNIEVIIIDDGSPDQCPNIIDHYAAKDHRIVAIHQNNSGYGKTINRGIKKARGEYISIIESDDWIEPDMLERLYMTAQSSDADIVKGLFWKTDSTLSADKQDIIFTNPSGVDLRLAPEDTFNITQWPTLVAFHASIWSAIYRRSFLTRLSKTAPLLTETAGAAYQDFPFAMKVLTAASKVQIVKIPFVHWRNEPNQVHSTNATSKKALQMMESCKTGIEIVKASPHYSAVKEALYIHALWTNLSFFSNIEAAYRKEYWQALRKVFLTIKNDSNFQYQFFRPQDKLLFNVITGKHYTTVQLMIFFIHARQKLKKLLH